MQFSYIYIKKMKQVCCQTENP